MKNKIIFLSVLTCTLLMSGCVEGVQSTSENNYYDAANSSPYYTLPNNTNQNTGNMNNYSQTYDYSSAYKEAVGGYFQVTDPKYDPSESGMSQDDYMQFFEISVENVSSTTWTLFSSDFYLKDPDGKVYNLDEDAFFYFEGGPDINEEFRPNEKTTFTIAVKNYSYDTLNGSVLYYMDSPVCTF